MPAIPQNPPSQISGSDCHSCRNPSCPNGTDCEARGGAEAVGLMRPPLLVIPENQPGLPASLSLSSLPGLSPPLLPQRVACIKVATISSILPSESFLFFAFDPTQGREGGGGLAFVFRLVNKWAHLGRQHPGPLSLLLFSTGSRRGQVAGDPHVASGPAWSLKTRVSILILPAARRMTSG